MKDETALIVLFFAICFYFFVKFCRRKLFVDDYPIGPGTYRVGVDLPCCTADLVVESGAGELCLKEKGSEDWSLTNKIGKTDDVKVPRFRNLTLNRGDTLEINGHVKLLLTEPLPIGDLDEEALGPGNYRFGVDIAPGKYNLKVLSGEGEVYLTEVDKKDYIFYQDMAAEDDKKADSYANLDCAKGFEMWIQGTLQIRLSPSRKKHFWQK